MFLKKNKKKELTVTLHFYDKDGNFITNDPQDAFALLENEQKNKVVSVILEAVTGLPHTP
jgi:hypothetical protein